jgi:hypothetical protein
MGKGAGRLGRRDRVGQERASVVVIRIEFHKEHLC